MVVLKAIGGFFAKIGRWIRDTAWVQPLLIVGGIFAIIFSIPKIVELVEDINEESNAAQIFFEKNEISAQGKEGKLSEGSTLDKFFTILEDDTSSSEKVYNDLNDLLKLNSKKFFIVFVDSTASCDSLYTGMNYLKNNWTNNEFKNDLKGSTFTYRTIYLDTIDEYDESTNLFDDCYGRHSFEQLAADLYNTQFAINKKYDETDGGSYYDNLAADASGFGVGTTLFFDFEKPAFDHVVTKGLRTCMYLSDVTGSGEYEKAQTLFYCWTESKKTVFGSEYVAD